jgi:hypothetical protein
MAHDEDLQDERYARYLNSLDAQERTDTMMMVGSHGMGSLFPQGLGSEYDVSEDSSSDDASLDDASGNSLAARNDS